MGVKIVKTVQDRLGVTAYRLGKILGVTQQAVRRWTGATRVADRNEGMSLRVLCKLRKASGLSWSAFGKELDAEFGEIESEE
jgi:DNA-binding transcriptional regulator YiaG